MGYRDYGSGDEDVLEIHREMTRGYDKLSAQIEELTRKVDDAERDPTGAPRKVVWPTKPQVSQKEFQALQERVDGLLDVVRQQNETIRDLCIHVGIDPNDPEELKVEDV